MITDPVAAARLWAADNPDAPGAAHVRAALDAAERYRLLAEVAQADGSAGCRIVLATMEADNRIVITSPHPRTEREIAETLGECLRMVHTIADEVAAEDVSAPEREEPTGLRVLSVGTHDLDALREYVGLPVAVLVGSKERIRGVAALLGCDVVVSGDAAVDAGHDMCTEPAPAVRDVLAEREKQRATWGDEIDDDADDGALAAAAALLASSAPDIVDAPKWAEMLRAEHCRDRRRQLVIAGALLLAEIERIDRAARR